MTGACADSVMLCSPGIKRSGSSVRAESTGRPRAPGAVVVYAERKTNPHVIFTYVSNCYSYYDNYNP